MTTPNAVERRHSSLARDWLNAARFYLGSRRGILALSAVAIGAGLAFNWSWLVATGIAPILLAVLPCAVMCGLGLCVHKLFGASHSTEQSQRSVAADKSEELPVQSNRAGAINSGPGCCSDPADAGAPVQMKPTSDDERRDSNA